MSKTIIVHTGQYFNRIEGLTTIKKIISIHLLLLASKTSSTVWYGKPLQAPINSYPLALFCAILACSKVGI
jgi:hypothetical protein